jgi:hypothetical protein
VADTALITTTIYVPNVLRQYRASDPDVLMIIAGDTKTPHDEVQALCEELGHAIYLTPKDQERLGYACSEVIGFRSIQRRNIALLEAIRLGAQVVVSIDDDNAPRKIGYFDDLREAFKGKMGAVFEGDKWFNLGDNADERFYYRGYPFSERLEPRKPWLSKLVEPGQLRVGIVNGRIYGDPDINAIDRYPDGGPRVDRYSWSNTPFYVNPRTTWTPINSQNTAYVRELAPLAFVLPGIGRYDDIWASYIAQRVMEATDYHVYFGEPSVIQERNPHDWLKDLENELYGMRHTEAFCEALKQTYIDTGHWEGATDARRRLIVMDNLTRVTTGPAAALLPQQTRDFMAAWLDDVARVL